MINPTIHTVVFRVFLVCDCMYLWQATRRTKNCHRFGKPNVRVQQVLIANQILAKIIACQIFDLINFGSEPNQALNMA